LQDNNDLHGKDVDGERGRPCGEKWNKEGLLKDRSTHTYRAAVTTTNKY